MISFEIDLVQLSPGRGAADAGIITAWAEVEHNNPKYLDDLEVEVTGYAVEDSAGNFVKVTPPLLTAINIYADLILEKVIEGLEVKLAEEGARFAPPERHGHFEYFGRRA